MAKKTSKPVQTTAEPTTQPTSTGKAMKPVRLDVKAETYARLEAAAALKGLTLAGYARMALMERLDSDGV